MGFIGNIIGSIFKGVLGGGHTTTPEAPRLTAREIANQMTAGAPTAPELGTKTKKRGRSSLIIDKNKNNNNSGTSALNI